MFLPVFDFDFGGVATRKSACFRKRQIPMQAGEKYLHDTTTREAPLKWVKTHEELSASSIKFLARLLFSF